MTRRRKRRRKSEVVGDIDQAELKKRVVQKLLKQADRDGDGTMDFYEFSDWFNSFLDSHDHKVQRDRMALTHHIHHP